MVKRLTKNDMKSVEQYKAERQSYTDAQAQNLGYPNAEVLRLSDRLSNIATQWRESKADTLVLTYQNILYQMIFKGYDVETLPIQDQLPPELMPELPQKVTDAIQRVFQTE